MVASSDRDDVGSGPLEIMSPRLMSISSASVSVTDKGA